jgi:hypothetical protein
VIVKVAYILYKRLNNFLNGEGNHVNAKHSFNCKDKDVNKYVESVMDDIPLPTPR